MSKTDIKARIERILSDILSDKYNAKITVRFRDLKEHKSYGNNDTSGVIGKSQILDK